MQTYLDITVGDSRLAACLHRPNGPQGAPWPIVIYCHGLTGSRLGTSYRLVTLARRLAERGIACLRFDFRGCGESDGRFEDVTPQTLLEDLTAAHNALVRMPELDGGRVGLVGSSFGAYTAARAAPRIAGLKCLVFLAPVADPRTLTHRDMTDAAWAILRKRGWIDHHGLPLSAAFLDGLPVEDVPTTLASTPRPLLVFHATGDPNVPIEQGRAYECAMRRAGTEVAFLAMDVPDHGMRSVEATQAIVDGSLQWLTRHLS
jgi:hypothetical protein